MRTPRRALALLGATALSIFFVAGPAAAVPTVSVSQTTGLTNNQVVQVTVSNADFSKSSVDAQECLRTATTGADCFLGLTQVPLDVSFGSGGGDFTAKALPECMPNLCAIVVVENDITTLDGGTAPKVNIDFAAAPPPTVPEAPKNLLLPFGAAIVFGLGTIVTLHRRRDATVGV